VTCVVGLIDVRHKYRRQEIYKYVFLELMDSNVHGNAFVVVKCVKNEWIETSALI